MKAAERQFKIRQLLKAQEFLDVPTLCRELAASASSIRRDLDALQRQKVLKRIHGGAVLLHR